MLNACMHAGHVLSAHVHVYELVKIVTQYTVVAWNVKPYEIETECKTAIIPYNQVNKSLAYNGKQNCSVRLIKDVLL